MFNVRVQFNEGMFWKYFCINELDLPRQKHSEKDPSGSQLYKRVSMKQGKTVRSKKNCYYNRSKKNNANKPKA